MAAGETQHFQEKWQIIQDGAERLILSVEGISTHQITSEEYMLTVYELCTEDPNKSHSVSQHIYDKYKEIFHDYITFQILPALKEKENEEFVREMVKKWSNHKIVVRWLFRFFHYLDRYYLSKQNLPSTEETGFMTFYDQVYLKMKVQLTLVLISMMKRERGGEEIDQSLVKNALSIYVEMGRGSMKYYEEDFEKDMLEDAAIFYSQKAANWIMVDSYADYMLKANGCLEKEKERVANYLPSNSQKKILEVLSRELFIAHATKLEEMKHGNGEDLVA
ncbi:hypothetical protein ACHQM5_026515 [Ranunculus cassubicifolius]